jgi:hypothetical protein
MKIPLIAVLLLSSFARAQVFRGPLSSSLGGTGRAAIDSPEGAFLNPALVSLIKGYELDGYFRDGLLDPDQHRHAWGVGAGDNRQDVLFPGSINYIRLRDTGRASGASDGELWHVAVGKNLGNYALGISGYMLTYKVEGDQSYTQWNYSLGGLWMINPDMGLAYVLTNIAKPGSDVPQDLREDLQQGLGFFMTIKPIARLRADITRNETNNPNQRLVYMLGFENQMAGFALFRMGYRLDDQRDQRYITAGVGLDGPRLKLDYTFEKNLAGTAEALHSVDLRLPF